LSSGLLALTPAKKTVLFNSCHHQIRYGIMLAVEEFGGGAKN